MLHPIRASGTRGSRPGTVRAEGPRAGQAPTSPATAARARREEAVLTTFRELGVLPETADALEAVGIIEAFPIQELTLPVALGGNDVIGQAKTGTGKTLGFGIPLLQRIVAPKDPGYADLKAPGAPQAIAVVPTRELCVQVTKDLELAGSGRGVRTLAIYGGRAYEPQVEALKKGIDVVVGTPGRLLDLARQNLLDLSHIRVLVLDEADEMLDLGFLPDVERIVAMTPAVRQTMLFSATMPGQVVALARRYMRQPTHIRAIDPHDVGATVDKVEQHVWRAHAMDKVELLTRVLQAEGRGLTMVFCRTKRTTQNVADHLNDRGFAAGAVHGDLGQGAREQAMRAFRNGKVDILVATDVAARGIDIEGVTHVVNYQCPEDDKTYVHRVGRTARAGASGVAVTFVDWDDLPRWGLINQALGLAFADPPETYSSSEHVYTGLNIPKGVTGTLPKSARTREGLDAEVVEDLGETGKVTGKSGSGSGSRSGGKGGRDGSRSGGGRDGGGRSGGGRSGGGRSGGGRSGGNDASPAAASTPSASGEAPAKSGASRNRSRRRTRGGKPAADA